MKRLSSAALALALAVSCTNSGLAPVEDESAVVGMVPAFEYAQPTKSLSSSGDGLLAFNWNLGEVVGVVPMNNKTVQTNFIVRSVGADPSKAYFDGGNWGVREGRKYAAYYPFVGELVASDASLSYSFKGQKQIASGNTSHLDAYSVMYAAAQSAADGKALFSFEHKISLLRFDVTMPAAGVFKKAVVTSDAACFAASGTLSLSDGSFAGSSPATEAVLDIDNVSVSEGGVLTLWLAVCPTSAVAGKPLKLAVTDNLNTTYKAIIEGVPASFEAGKVYAFTAAARPESKIFYTLDSTDPTLKSSASGSSSYTSGVEFTVDGIVWYPVANTSLNPWRIGGKNLSNAVRTVSTRTPMPKEVTRVLVTCGDIASDLVVNSTSLEYSASADFADARSVSFTVAKNQTSDVDVMIPAGSYIRFLFNVSTSSSSNRAMEFKKVELYD